MATDLKKGTALKSLALGSLVLTNANYDELYDLIAAKVASVGATADKGIEIGGTATAPTVGIKLDSTEGNLASLGSGGLMVTAPTADTYTIEKATTADSGYAATYQLFKNGSAVSGSKIQIIKDQFLTGATLVDQDGSGNPGKFIKLEFAVKSDSGETVGKSDVYLDVADLIDVYTSGSQASDQIVVAVDSATNKITATLSDGSVTNAQLAGGITYAKLSTASGELKDKVDAGVAAKAAVDGILEDAYTGFGTLKALKDEIDTKQDALTFDNAPTSGSDNPVKSGGVYTALTGKADKLGNLSDSTTVSELITALGGTIAVSGS